MPLLLYQNAKVSVLYPSNNRSTIVGKTSVTCYNKDTGSKIYGKAHWKRTWFGSSVDSFLKCSNQSVSSWTGFNIITRNSNDLTEDAVGYLPTIDASATSMNTVLEILTNDKLIRDALQLESVIIVFDQAIYIKATEFFGKILFSTKTSLFEWESFIPSQCCLQ